MNKLILGCCTALVLLSSGIAANAQSVATSASAKKGLVVCRTAGSQINHLSGLIAKSLLERGHRGFSVEVSTNFVERDQPIEPVKYFNSDSYSIDESANICSTVKGVSSCKPCNPDKDGAKCKLSASVSLEDVAIPALQACKVTRKYTIKTTLANKQSVITEKEVELPGVYINIAAPVKEVAKAK